MRTALVGLVVFGAAAIAISSALTIGLGVGFGVVCSGLGMAVDRSWQRQGIPKKRPELA